MRASTTIVSMTTRNGSANRFEEPSFAEPKQASNRLPPQPASAAPGGNGNGPQYLRMYTEEQVAAMLQVSLSQLRKWRMKKNGETHGGPPFRKIGRLVRYPESALLVYINSE